MRARSIFILLPLAACATSAELRRIEATLDYAIAAGVEEDDLDDVRVEVRRAAGAAEARVEEGLAVVARGLIGGGPAVDALVTAILGAILSYRAVNVVRDRRRASRGEPIGTEITPRRRPRARG